MRTYEEVIDLLATYKYEDLIAGARVSRFEGLKIAAFVFEKKIIEVNAAVEARIAEMQKGD